MAEGAENHVPAGARVGRVIEGRYRLDAPLGEGGLGVVWRGFHLRLGKPIAIKLMQREHLEMQALRARFEREARSLAALSHPNIVDVIDFGIDENQPFLVMELLEGRSLEQALTSGLSPGRALGIARDVARALAHAHSHGIVHRDLKPANIFLQRIGEGTEMVRVLDFGLAKFISAREDDAPLTQTGMVIGTPAYMAPEQATGGSADARADVYTFGLVLFEMLAGRRAFEGEGSELVRQQLLMPLPDLSEARPDLEVAVELQSLLSRSTAKSPSERFADAKQLIEALFALPEPAVRVRPGVHPPLHVARTDVRSDTRALRDLGTARTLHAGDSQPAVDPASVTAVDGALHLPAEASMTVPFELSELARKAPTPTPILSELPGPKRSHWKLGVALFVVVVLLFVAAFLLRAQF